MAITPKDMITRIRDSAAQLADRARNALRMCLVPGVCLRRR
jgi:hypothetical protein